MPPRPPIPHLPPLPPASTWHTYFPRRLLAASQIDPAWVLRGRTVLANREHCDAFVRELGIRPGEVIVEVNPGPGLLTRSLLEGGVGAEDADEKAWRAWKAVREEAGQAKATSSRISMVPKFRGVKKEGTSWPAWTEDTVAAPRRKLPVSHPGSIPSPSSGKEYLKPAVVVASEPCSPLLERAFNYRSTFRKPDLQQADDQAVADPSSEAEEMVSYAAFKGVDHEAAEAVGMQRSAYHPNLILSESSAYRWFTLPAILNDPLLAPYLSPPSSDPDGTSPSGSARRKWEDDPPNITIVANIPDAVNGEQLLAQWIGSAVGGDNGRHWAWRHGRVRLAVLCGKGMYDRIMARPRETINCKVSVMASALFHRRPLPPYHHVANVDKAGRRTSSSLIKATPNAKATVSPIIDPLEGDWTDTPTTTLPSDFYPPTGQFISETPLSRPTLMGVMLTPRLVSPILPHQKDAWDYVLRNCFIRETQPLSEATKNLGFGAENLLPRFADADEGYKERWRGTPVDPKTKVKDMTNEQWARVVDVFDKWLFKPETLMLASDTATDASRELGAD